MLGLLQKELILTPYNKYQPNKYSVVTTSSYPVTVMLTD